MLMEKRGRPKFTMTTKRKLALLELADLEASGRRVNLAELARRCGMYDYRDARRTLNDLRVMGRVV